MKRYDLHVFVCENKREEGHPRGCCSDKGSVAFREQLKLRVKKLGLPIDVRVNSAGCLDACEFGAVMVVYPEGTWYGGVQEQDIDEIIESHIKLGKPVERLIIKDKRFHKDEAK
ncbi:MAG: (2Fe-2S) ferredoxin domain-containing protein [Ignavibacteriales bacterium]|nr:(2Fe-2S) ferredoxin domain-containing protein [Ignavibacteriales bacterium]